MVGGAVVVLPVLVVVVQHVPASLLVLSTLALSTDVTGLASSYGGFPRLRRRGGLRIVGGAVVVLPVLVVVVQHVPASLLVLSTLALSTDLTGLVSSGGFARLRWGGGRIVGAAAVVHGASVAVAVAVAVAVVVVVST